MLFLPTSIENLEVGDKLLEPVFDHNGRLLLDAGLPILDETVSHLEKEGVVRVLVNPRNAERRKQCCAPSNVLANCELCGNGMALCPPGGVCLSRPYGCNDCDAIYIGSYDCQCSGVFCGPERVFCDRSTCSHIREMKLDLQNEIDEFTASCLTGKLDPSSRRTYAGAERRQSVRHPLEVLVVVVPLNEYYRVIDRPRLASTQDISTTGLSLISDRSFDASSVVVDFNSSGNSKLRLVANVVWESKRDAGWHLGARICGRIDPEVGDLAELMPQQMSS